jgi:type VI secretion system protein ImpF
MSDNGSISGSVLDRLMNRGSATRGLTVRELQASVRRDVEALLNARRPWAPIPDRFAPLRQTILGYGLPDYASGAFNAPAEREALCREIATAIRLFEPRLTHVSVTLRDRTDSMDPLLRIRIEALLRAEEADEPVAFDSLLDSTTADMILRADANG